MKFKNENESEEESTPAKILVENIFSIFLTICCSPTRWIHKEAIQANEQESLRLSLEHTGFKSKNVREKERKRERKEGRKDLFEIERRRKKEKEERREKKKGNGNGKGRESEWKEERRTLEDLSFEISTFLPFLSFLFCFSTTCESHNCNHGS